MRDVDESSRPIHRICAQPVNLARPQSGVQAETDHYLSLLLPTSPEVYQVFRTVDPLKFLLSGGFDEKENVYPGVS